MSGSLEKKNPPTVCSTFLASVNIQDASLERSVAQMSEQNSRSSRVNLVPLALLRAAPVHVTAAGPRATTHSNEDVSNPEWIYGNSMNYSLSISHERRMKALPVKVFPVGAA